MNVKIYSKVLRVEKGSRNNGVKARLFPHHGFKLLIVIGSEKEADGLWDISFLIDQSYVLKK